MVTCIFCVGGVQVIWCTAECLQAEDRRKFVCLIVTVIFTNTSQKLRQQASLRSI